MQLKPRLLSRLLSRLIARCTKEHPYHALPIIMALANSDADQAEIDAGKYKNTIFHIGLRARTILFPLF